MQVLNSPLLKYARSSSSSSVGLDGEYGDGDLERLISSLISSLILIGGGALR